MTDTNENQRNLPRYMKQIDITYTVAGEEYDSHTINISKTGLFIHCPEPLESGTPLKIEMNLPDDRGEVIALATVVWARRTEIEKTGMGVVLTSINQSSKTALNEYIDDLTLI